CIDGPVLPLGEHPALAHFLGLNDSASYDELQTAWDKKFPPGTSRETLNAALLAGGAFQTDGTKYPQDSLGPNRHFVFGTLPPLDVPFPMAIDRTEVIATIGPLENTGIPFAYSTRCNVYVHFDDNGEISRSLISYSEGSL